MSVVSASAAPTPLGRWARLRARFDGGLMRPPAPLQLAAVPAALDPRWLTWCHQADAAAVAAVRAGAGIEATLEHAMQVLDGSVALVACGGRLSGWRYRLGLKAREFLQPQPRLSDPWDAGWLRPGPAVLARLAAFQPRRHTLVVVPAAQVAQVLAWLQARPVTVAAPGSLRLRLLLVCPPGQPGLERLEAALQSRTWAPLSAGLWLE